jgi:hypothetical protein
MLQRNYGTQVLEGTGYRAPPPETGVALIFFGFGFIIANPVWKLRGTCKAKPVYLNQFRKNKPPSPSNLSSKNGVQHQPPEKRNLNCNSAT